MRVSGVFTVVGMVLLASSAEASFKCMPHALYLASKAFEKARAKGLVVVDQDDKQVNLGTEVQVYNVNVADHHKNAYGIDFIPYSIDGHLAKVKIRLVVHSVDSETCEIDREATDQLERPVFRIYKRLRD